LTPKSISLEPTAKSSGDEAIWESGSAASRYTNSNTGIETGKEEKTDGHQRQVFITAVSVLVIAIAVSTKAQPCNEK
jgi:hypothetical protein